MWPCHQSLPGDLVVPYTELFSDRKSTIQGGPERMQHLRSIKISRKLGTEWKSCVHYCVYNSFPSKMTPRSFILMKVVLILWPYFWGNVIFKICFSLFYQKSRLRSEGISLSSFPGIVTLQSYKMNASLYSCCLRFSKHEQTLYPGEPNSGNLRYVNCDFWDRSGKFWKWHCLSKTAIESKRLHQNDWSWCHCHSAGKRIFYAFMHSLIWSSPWFLCN